MKKIAKNELTALFRFLAEKKDVFVPVKNGNQANFGLWTEEVEVDLDTLKTVKSAKDCFFPQSETLYRAYQEGKKITLDPEKLVDEDFVVFGMRGCDVQGLVVLDQVFLAEPVDNYYAARREHGIIVTMACHEPNQTCFCNVFGINPANPVADVTVWMLGDDLYWEATSEKGQAFTAEVAEFLQDEDAAPVEEEKVAIAEKVEKLPYSNLSLEGFNGDRLMELFNSPKWADLYKACLACGTCTFVCPTCQCYDIRDFKTANGIQRYRCWDSCMYSDFTMMAHGNNRNSQLERFRQRFMHKLVYFPANNNGMYSCVGCGRCVAKCPSSLNIVKVIKSLGVSYNV